MTSTIRPNNPTTSSRPWIDPEVQQIAHELSDQELAIALRAAKRSRRVIDYQILQAEFVTRASLPPSA